MSLLLPVHLLTGELQRKLLGTLPGRHAVRNMLVRTGFHGAEQRGLIQREVVQRTLQSRIQRRPNNTHLPLASFFGDPIVPPDSFATACAPSAPTSLISALRKSTASRRSAPAALVDTHQPRLLFNRSGPRRLAGGNPIPRSAPTETPSPATSHTDRPRTRSTR